jgi:hypothetical protein
MEIKIYKGEEARIRREDVPKPHFQVSQTSQAIRDAIKNMKANEVGVVKVKGGKDSFVVGKNEDGTDKKKNGEGDKMLSKIQSQAKWYNDTVLVGKNDGKCIVYLRADKSEICIEVVDRLSVEKHSEEKERKDKETGEKTKKMVFNSKAYRKERNK